ncbi:LUC7-like protein [Helicosporidium sp. ATCC 50920]|nr:LUC7-like protein [Helicosporidium sp. ATCC 50920]|eukprot:KDD72763.1 LUC7-like protein [Helicosporidium sp. ATCC 50920]
MRAMLDELMGPGRDLPAEERAKIQTSRDWRDPQVCRYFLAGFCPYEEFRRTKQDLGDCPAVHDSSARSAWEALLEETRQGAGHEAELLRWLDRLLQDLERRKEASMARLNTAPEGPQYLAEDQTRLEVLAAQIAAALASAGDAGEEGDVDVAQALTEEAEALRAQKTQLESAAAARAGNSALKGLRQEVCPISGLIINNDEARMRDHHTGRNYNAWKRLREVHERLLQKFGGVVPRETPRNVAGKDRGRGGAGEVRDARDARDMREGRAAPKDGRSHHDSRTARRRSRSREAAGPRDRREDRGRWGERDRHREDRGGWGPRRRDDDVLRGERDRPRHDDGPRGERDRSRHDSRERRRPRNGSRDGRQRRDDSRDRRRRQDVSPQERHRTSRRHDAPREEGEVA